MSFAIIKTGGKQYKVKEGDTIKVEKLSSEKEIEFTDLLYGKKVNAEIMGTEKGTKIKVLKQQAKKRYKRISGHRQILSILKIKEIK